MARIKQRFFSLVSMVQLISQDIGMEFWIKKCGMVVLKRGKLYKSEGIKLINGQTIKEVGHEGYEYLYILEVDKFKEREMKEIFRTEYLRRFKLKSQLNVNNKSKVCPKVKSAPIVIGRARTTHQCRRLTPVSVG